MSRRPPTEPTERSTLRAVAIPSEHGGWGLTLEPGLLGLLIAPSASGACLAGAALLAFLARTPLKLALVDRRRGRRLERTIVAERAAALEIALIVVLAIAAVAAASNSWWWVPLAAAGPLFAVELWHDVRSRSRRLLPELAGAAAVASVAAAIVLAAGEPWELAVGAWLVLAARVATSIPHVRGLIMSLHGRPASPVATTAGDVAAACGAVVAYVLDERLLAGTVAVIAVIAFQRAVERGPSRPAKVIGIQQTVLGFTVVLATAIGVWTL